MSTNTLDGMVASLFFERQAPNAVVCNGCNAIGSRVSRACVWIEVDSALRPHLYPRQKLSSCVNSCVSSWVPRKCAPQACLPLHASLRGIYEVDSTRHARKVAHGEAEIGVDPQQIAQFVRVRPRGETCSKWVIG